MRIPLFIYSDASFENGNDTAKTMVSCASAAGFGRVGIIDYSSSSAVVKFIKSCSSNEVRPLVGATLKIHSPIRDKALWAFKNKSAINDLYTRLSLTPPPVLAAFDEVIAVVNAIEVAKKSKANNRIAKFQNIVAELVGDRCDDNSEFLNNCLDKSFFKKTSIDANRISRVVSSGHVVVVANSLSGYKSVMRLISIKALNKSYNIKHPDEQSKPEAITWEDITLEGEDVIVVDPMNEKSFFGAFSGLRKNDMGVALKILSTGQLRLDHFGLDFPISAAKQVWIDKVKGSFQNTSWVPFPTASFAKKEFHEDYVIKFSVQTGLSVTNPFFSPPEDDQYIYDSSLVEQSYAKQKEIDDSFLVDFWDDIADTNVKLGDVQLPNYDMPTVEVINYAFKLKGVDRPLLTDPESAIAAFDAWISPDILDGWELAAFRQRRLNDFCLHKLSLEGVHMRLRTTYEGDALIEQEPIYIERHEMEFGVIEKMGFSGYFLIEFDMVSEARRLGVPVGDGRGSAAGSLIVYGLEITDVDPIVFDLQFERFLNPERVSMPDIDVDFGTGQSADRLSVLRYVSEKYQMKGARFPSSSQIANMNNYQLKSSISAVRKSLGLSMTYENHLKFLIKKVEISLGINADVGAVNWTQFLEHDSVIQMALEQPVFRKILRHAKTLTGKMSTYGVHAGGLVISPTTITDFSAMECDDKGNFFTLFDKDDIESAGLIKFDVLGLRTLSIIDDAVAQVKENHGVLLDPRKFDLEDERVFGLICDQHLCDIFQLESTGMRNLVGDLQPRSIGEIGVLSSLFRPGALQSGMVEEYVDVKFDRKKPTYDHPALEKVTKDTFGCIVYQEQVMSITRELAGYSLGEADLLRRAMGKKKIEEMIRQKQVYNGRAQAHWSEHYKEIGVSQGFSFELNINLSDLKKELQILSDKECLDADGYLSDFDSVMHFLKTLLGLDELGLKQLKARVNDFNYVVKLFKEQYHHLIEKACRKKLSDFEEDRVFEVCTRVYFALTQYVRFNQVFNKVEKFAGYGFNKSHAIAYSLVTFKATYLKCYYPVEFYCAALTFKKLSALAPTVIEASKVMGIKMLPPHINLSKERFSSGGKDSIRYGLAKLLSMANLAKEVVAERERSGDYTSLFDVLQRVPKLSKDGVFSLAACGAFDLFIPRTISVRKEFNGREFLVWLNSIIRANKAKDKEQEDNYFHSQIINMNDYELISYLAVIAGGTFLKNNNFTSKEYLSLINKKMSYDLFAQTMEKIRSRMTGAAGDISPSSVVGVLVRKWVNSPASLTSFEMGFLRHYSIFLGDEDVGTYTFEHSSLIQDSFAQVDAESRTLLKEKHQDNILEDDNFSNFSLEQQCQEEGAEPNILDKTHSVYSYISAWESFFSIKLAKSITETLNDERDCSGIYITSTPIKVLRIADRVEREPPSSIIDGCPVPIGMLDASYAEQRVTTYGIIREVIEKTVKKEDSAWYGEKMLFLTLENGAETVKCMIFGNKPVSVMKKVIEDGSVILAAGEISAKENFGITLKIQAIKRYFPVEDEKVIVVPSM